MSAVRDILDALADLGPVAQRKDLVVVAGHSARNAIAAHLRQMGEPVEPLTIPSPARSYAVIATDEFQGWEFATRARDLVCEPITRPT